MAIVFVRPVPGSMLDIGGAIAMALVYMPSALCAIGGTYAVVDHFVLLRRTRARRERIRGAATQQRLFEATRVGYRSEPIDHKEPAVDERARRRAVP